MRVRRVAALLAAALVVPACGEIVALDTPEIARVERRPPEQSYVYDAAGNQLAILRHEFRERVGLDEVPAHLVDAVLAAEDQRFFVHKGVDARAIARAALRNTAAGEIEQGGSTITQQLVENLYLPDTPETFATKAREALLARDLEEELTKEQILEEYLNTVYFGNGAYGVEAAAYTYWRKPAAELTVPESALLAGIIRAPETLNPAESPRPAQARRDRVLRSMGELGSLTAQQVSAAVAAPVEVAARPPTPQMRHPYWVRYIERTVLSDPAFGEDRDERAQRLYGGGLRIHTTLDPDVQAKAEAAAHRWFDDPDDPEVAIAVVEPATGRVLATVGGRDFDTRQYDLATQGQRQPGSTFKTFVLTAAIASGWRPDDRISGRATTFQLDDYSTWRVRNFEGASYGTLSLADATRRSVNGAFARLIFDVGVGRVMTTARAMGIDSPLNPDPAIALGGTRNCCTPLEMAAAYGTLANDGERVPVSPIDRIEDSEGKVIWRADHVGRHAVDPGVAWIVNQMLRAVVEGGTGVRARLPGGWEAAGKTGTVQNYTDAWFVGYTPTLAASVWMGYPDRLIPMRYVAGESRVTGGSWPARIWRELMTDILAGQEPVPFAPPEEALVEVEIDPQTGLLAAPWCPGEKQVLPSVLAPKRTCPRPPPPTEAAPQPGPTGSDGAGSPPPAERSEPQVDGEESPSPTASPTSTASPTPTPSPSGSPSASPTPTETETGIGPGNGRGNAGRDDDQ